MIALIIITIVSIVLGIRQAKLIMLEGDAPVGSKRAPLIFLMLISSYFAVSFYNAFLLILCSLVGFILALAVFLMTFMRCRAGLSWPKVSLYTGGGIGFMCFMAWILNRNFPPGLVTSRGVKLRSIEAGASTEAFVVVPVLHRNDQISTKAGALEEFWTPRIRASMWGPLDGVWLPSSCRRWQAEF